MSPSRICLISLHYYSDYLARSLNSFEMLSVLLGASTRILISNNIDITERLRRETSGSRYITEVIQHDNTGLEFGAYQAGLDRARLTCDADWYVVVNDTFSIHECFATPLRDRFVRAIRDTGRTALPVIAGQVDQLSRSFQLRGCRTHRWVRSSVMALNVAAVSSINFRLYQPQLDDCIKATTDIKEFFAKEIDQVLRERLTTWLFGNSASGSWYNAAELTDKSKDRLANKARAILQEMYLSARLDYDSALFIDIRQMSFACAILCSVERRIFRWRELLRGQAINQVT